MNKGDLVEINLDGKTTTVCIIGFYIDEDSGEEVALLVVVPPDALLQIPVEELADSLDIGRWWN